MSHLTESNEWKALEAHFQDAKTWHMRNLFAKDPARAKKFSAEACGLFLDYSKNIITIIQLSTSLFFYNLSRNLTITL